MQTVMNMKKNEEFLQAGLLLLTLTVIAAFTSAHPYLCILFAGLLMLSVFAGVMGLAEYLIVSYLSVKERFVMDTTSVVRTDFTDVGMNVSIPHEHLAAGDLFCVLVNHYENVFCKGYQNRQVNVGKIEKHKQLDYDK